jgi:prepilin-type N-terminal cleavage/methylation domain-containing protein
MKKGFTLIELLVVVLIIGILAAVALPQYEKAVLKSRASKAQTYVRQLANAMEMYYLSNGSYPKYFSDLDIDFSSAFPNKLAKSELDPYAGGVTSTEVLSNGEIELIIYRYGPAIYSKARVRDSNEKRTGSGFAFLHATYVENEAYKGKMICFDRLRGNQSNFCRGVMGMTTDKFNLNSSAIGDAYLL